MKKCLLLSLLLVVSTTTHASNASFADDAPDAPALHTGVTPVPGEAGPPSYPGLVPSADPAEDPWQADIAGTGEAVEGASNVSTVTIGASSAGGSTTPAPPAPPTYTVQLRLWTADFAAGPFIQDLRPTDTPTSLWVLEVDPHGNVPPPTPRTATVSWDPTELGEGAWALVEGFDGTGPIVVADMENTTSFTVTDNSPQYYTIIFEPTITEMPIELTSFAAVASGQQAALTWETASETNNAGFHIEQARAGEAFETIGYVEGAGTTTEPQRYRFNTAALDFGTYHFRLLQMDRDGTTHHSAAVEVSIALPEAFVLEEPYPNPFNPEATVRFAVRREGTVHLELYNTLGQRVRVLFAGSVPAGQMQEVRIDGHDLASGLYLVHLRGAGIHGTRRVLLLK